MDNKRKVIVIGSSGVTNKELLMTEISKSLSATGGVEIIPSDKPMVDIFPNKVINPDPEFLAPFIYPPVPQTEEKPWQHNPVKTPWLEKHVNIGYKKKR